MRILWAAAVAICAIATAGCDFTGLPDDRGALTKGPGAGGGADSSVQDASTAGDAASGADATVSADSGPAADAGDACAPESDEAFCLRLGADCGRKSATDSCGRLRSVASCGACGDGGACSAQNTCPWVASTGEFGARTARMTGAGVSDCGPGNESCASSPLVAGGTYYRGTDGANPATVGDFRLDKYEVTLGRFRPFVDAWMAGWRPSAGSGKHTHLNGGRGLEVGAGTYESGWDTAWNAHVGAPSADSVAPAAGSGLTRTAWSSSLDCVGGYSVWTRDPTSRRPLNCLSWYDLYAFCIWDGGFLPSEAEWEYAATGGSEERKYPWGNGEPVADTSLAVYGCYLNPGSTADRCVDVSNIAPVGSAPAGAGLWGQLDLAGNVWEWTVDWLASLGPLCENCANAAPGTNRILRGGSFDDDRGFMTTTHRRGNFPAARYIDYVGYGGRCARSP